MIKVVLAVKVASQDYSAVGELYSSRFSLLEFISNPAGNARLTVDVGKGLDEYDRAAPAPANNGC